MNTQLWHRPAVIALNNFKFKSLSNWSYNIAIGCEHACRFCYVPDSSTNRMASRLKSLGVNNPDAEWGDYVFLRKWDENAFLRSLREAEKTPASELKADGNRAVMLCTTTDPYQVGPAKAVKSESEGSAILSSKEFQDMRRQLVRRALKIILEESTLNVRILTRSPLAREDFDLMKQFGNRLLFGMSLPTLNNRLAKIYEPKAPAPSKRLETLQAAKKAGLNVYVAVAPVYPECEAEDMNATLRAVRDLEPVTVFMEPINIRAENVERIDQAWRDSGAECWHRKSCFQDAEHWRDYALKQLQQFEQIAYALDIGKGKDILHLWPDQSLGSRDAVKQSVGKDNPLPDDSARDYLTWLNSHWNKISAWPGKK